MQTINRKFVACVVSMLVGAGVSSQAMAHGQPAEFFTSDALQRAVAEGLEQCVRTEKSDKIVQLVNAESTAKAERAEKAEHPVKAGRSD